MTCKEEACFCSLFSSPTQTFRCFHNDFRRQLTLENKDKVCNFCDVNIFFPYPTVICNYKWATFIKCVNISFEPDTATWCDFGAGLSVSLTYGRQMINTILFQLFYVLANCWLIRMNSYKLICKFLYNLLLPRFMFKGGFSCLLFSKNRKLSYASHHKNPFKKKSLQIRVWVFG